MHGFIMEKHHFLLIQKVAAETALMYLSYNIRRAIRLAGGVQRLIARCRVFFSSGIPMPI